VDFGLGNLPIGDILEQEDGAAFAHRIDGNGEPALVLGVEQNLAIGGARQPAFESERQPLGPLFRQGPRGEALLRQGTNRQTPFAHVVGQTEQFAQPPIADDDPPFGIDHAEAVRHVVEGGIETSREPAHIAAGDHRIEQHAA
jgi:hypothetical protein